MFTRQNPCDENPASKFSEKCNKKSNYRTLIIVDLSILAVAGAAATVASFGGFTPVEAGLVGVAAASGL